MTKGILVVTHDSNDSGNCREYYKVVTINGNAPANSMLVCVQEEMPGCIQWYTTSNDGCWNEPCSYIRKTFQIEDETGKVLREAVIEPTEDQSNG